MSQVHARTEGATLHLSLAGTLTIAEATETRSDLLVQMGAMAADVTEVQLDLAGVPEIDTAGIQLLIATARTLRSQGRNATLAQRSDVVDTVSRALGAADDGQCCGFRHTHAAGGAR